MLAYKDDSLDALTIFNEASEANRLQLITNEELTAIHGAYSPDLYTPNLFIRIGLFVATLVVSLMGIGLLLLLLQPVNSNIGSGLICFIYGVAAYVALELIISRRKHFHSGIDDGLLWSAFGFAVASYIIIFDNSPAIVASLFTLTLSAYLTARFANAVAGAVAFGSFLAVIFYSLLEAGTIARYIMPFAFMIASTGIYFLVRLNKSRFLLRNYQGLLIVLEVLSLCMIYISTNYLIVREGGIALLGVRLAPEEELSGGWFFWSATFIIPAVYIIKGVYAKDSVILRTGLLLAVATALTVRFYYSFAPIEQVLIFSGIGILAVVYLITRYLKKPKHGISSEEKNDSYVAELLQLEGLAIAETFQKVPVVDGPEFQFGGGSSGGAGASAKY
jgi:hypothetical protein